VSPASCSVCVCLSAEPRLHTALVSAAKVMRCIQCSLVLGVAFCGVGIDLSH